MNVLAIDTATERCSVALKCDGRLIERSLDTARGHAELVLSMVDAVLEEGGVALAQLAGIAYGRGPGAFTGVRIAIGVVQGLSYAARIPTIGVSNLAAVAYQVLPEGSPILVCMDARMNEVYWAVFDRGDDAPLEALTPERVGRPETVDVGEARIQVLAGTGAAAYPKLASRFPDVRVIHALPRARDILLLGEHALREGRGGSAFDAQPVYLRDQVTDSKPR